MVMYKSYKGWSEVEVVVVVEEREANGSTSWRSRQYVGVWTPRD